MRILLAAILSFNAAQTALAQHVERRGGETTLHGEIMLVDAAGVTVRSDLGATHFVPWDRVRKVVTADFQSQIQRYGQTAEALWRARSRVERGDMPLAELLFDRLFEQYRGQSNETALVVAEGLLRCRLARGDHAAAVVPVLEVIRLHRAGVATISYAQLPPIVDGEYDLCSALAPVWLPSPGLTTAYHELMRYDAQGDEVAAAIAGLYARSMADVAAPDDESSLTLAELPDSSGVELLSDLIACRSGDTAERNAARQSLVRRIDGMPEFARAWTRYAVGMSLLAESGVVRKQRGMVSLLHIPAMYSQVQPYLAGIALRRVADAMDASGETAAAEALRSDLSVQFPYHPVLTGSLPKYEFQRPKENG